jgi:hypothetical protein
MKIDRRFLLPAALLLCASFTSVIAHARDLRLDLPVSDAMRNATWRASVAHGIEFRFGTDSAAPIGAVLTPRVTVSNYARPWVTNGAQRVRRDDAPTCNEALRNALGDLAEQARKVGATGVINITSKFLDSVQTSRTEFACNSGTGSAEVELSAQFLIRSSASPAPATSADSANIERIFPPASNFADINDVNAIPNLSAGCRKAYEDEWLKAALPRAFAITSTGRCRGAWSYAPRNPEEAKDPGKRALENCARINGMECKLYAVDNVVVYRP